MADKNNSPLEIFPGAARDFGVTIFNHLEDAVVCLGGDRKILFWNRAAEQISGRESDEILGKICFDESGLFVDAEGINICKGKCPFKLALKDGVDRSLEIYLQHKDGFRIPVTLRVIPVKNGAGEIIGAAGVFVNTAPKVTIPLSVSQLERMGLIDPDTGIASKQYLDMTLQTRLEEFQRYNLAFGLIYVDIDGYDRILEKHGRFNAGKILRTVARTLHKNIRFFDIVGRWSTEEFLIILLNIDESRLDIVANKLRLLISESYITTETGMLNATVSMGASLVLRYDSVESLVKRGEQLMMHSKWLGKNRVSLSFVQKDME